MKSKIIVLIASLSLAIAAFGYGFQPFHGWDFVKQHSTDIIIARCTKSVDAPELGHGLLYSDIEVVKSLVGRTNLEPARLYSVYWPHPGEYYLIFSYYTDGLYSATETYRVVEIGPYLPPDLLSGKTLDENLGILFERRLEDLDRQMKEEQEEKERLEEFVKK